MAVGGLLSNPSIAQTWLPTTAPTNTAWQAVSSSADGTRLFAIGRSYVYATSTNSGATWTTNTEPQIGSEYGTWNCNASSADGNTLLAMNGDAAWISTNSGVSWSSNTVPTANFWSAVALSADGKKAVAVDGGPSGDGGPGGIYVSTNSGMAWNEMFAPSNTWSSVASSADGTILSAAVLVDSLPTVPVYVSTNSGTAWTPTASPTNMQCTAIASSADGRKLIVAGFEAQGTGAGMVYTSTNSGSTWISNTVSLFARWSSVASSADGTTLAAVSEYGTIYTSTNSGTIWNSNSVPLLSWLSVASSADGAKLAATGVDIYFHGGIYTFQSTPSPQLNFQPSGTNLNFSWLIPSTNFVLRQNLDLTTANWSAVTNPPMLNLTNLQKSDHAAHVRPQCLLQARNPVM